VFNNIIVQICAQLLIICRKSEKNNLENKMCWHVLSEKV